MTDPTLDPPRSAVPGASAAEVQPPEWRRPGLYEWYFARTPYGRRIRAKEEQVVFDALESVLLPNQRVMELGSGTGHYTVRLAREVGQVVGLDASPAMVQFLEQRVRREGITNVVAEEGVVPRPYTGPDGFDGLVAVGVLNYVPQLDEALRWIRQRLRPGGFTVFTVPSAGPTGHLSRLTAALSRKRVYPASSHDVQRALANAGLDVRDIAGAGLGGRDRTLVVHAAAPA